MTPDPVSTTSRPAADNDTVILTARALSARVGSRWLFQDLDLRLTSGRVCAVLGPNGVGKTTLMRTLIGLRVPDNGTIDRHAPIGYVPQRSETAFAFRALDMVVMGRARHIGPLRTPGPHDHALARMSLGRLGILSLAERTFDTLSGGERQLVLIARALATEPKLLLLDEPASALDLSRQARLLTILRDLARQDGLAVLFTTHHPQHAGAIADDAVLMGAGSVEAGPAEVLLESDRLRALYGVPVEAVEVPVEGRRVRTLVPIVEPPENRSAD